MAPAARNETGDWKRIHLPQINPGWRHGAIMREVLNWKPAPPRAGVRLMPTPAAASHAALSDLPLKEAATVQSVGAPVAAPEWRHWLEEIGFLPGERVELLARAEPGGDPLVVRVGDSTFALRRAEAACVQVLTRVTPAR